MLKLRHEQFRCTDAAKNAMKWIEENKEEIHKNGSGRVLVSFETK